MQHSGEVVVKEMTWEMKLKICLYKLIKLRKLFV